MLGEVALGSGEIRDVGVTEEAVWVAQDTGPSSGEVLQWWSDRALWVSAGGDPPALLRLDPATGSFATIASGPSSFGVGAGVVWVPLADPGSGRLSVQRIDAGTADPLGSPIPLGDPIFWPFAADESGVWFVGGREEPAVAHLDAATLEVDRWLPVPGNPLADVAQVLAALDQRSGMIWVGDPWHRAVYRIAPS